MPDTNPERKPVLGGKVVIIRDSRVTFPDAYLPGPGLA